MDLNRSMVRAGRMQDEETLSAFFGGDSQVEVEIDVSELLTSSIFVAGVLEVVTCVGGGGAGFFLRQLSARRNGESGFFSAVVCNNFACGDLECLSTYLITSSDDCQSSVFVCSLDAFSREHSSDA